MKGVLLAKVAITGAFHKSPEWSVRWITRHPGITFGNQLEAIVLYVNHRTDRFMTIAMLFPATGGSLDTSWDATCIVFSRKSRGNKR